MKKASTTWNKSFVAVCTRCHEGLDQSNLTLEGNAGERLKDFLKAQLRAQGHAGACRVVNASCLGLCPPAAQAVLVQSHNETGEMVVVHPEQDRDALLKVILQQLDS